MLRILFFCFVFSSLAICQQDSVKQITDFPFDCKNVAFFVNAFNAFSNTEGAEVVFEGYTSSESRIYTLTYNPEPDTFINLRQISTTTSVNRNPAAFYTYSESLQRYYKIILWEAFNGNDWDIYASADTGEGWSEPYPFLNTSEDETDVALNSYHYGQGDQFTYTKGKSLCLYDLSDSASQVIFEGNDSVSYSAGRYLYDYDYLFVAERRINNSFPQIIYYDKRQHWDNTIDTIGIFAEENPAAQPELFINWNEPAMIYEADINNKKYLKGISLYYNENFYNPFYFLQDTTLESFAFNYFSFPIPVVKRSSDFFSGWPYTYSFIRNDSSFVVINVQDYYSENPGYYRKVNGSEPKRGFVGYSNNYQLINYTIWEDSSSGGINLFGVGNIFTYSDVKDEVLPSYYLSQNYPNPFNPVTNISYSIKSRGYVTLKVYDILGKEVTTLVHEEKPAGNYEVTFNGSSLASGVYIYRLTSGQFSESKKLLLLK